MHIFHVHFIFERKDEYYGSIAAIYQHHIREELGVAYHTLRNAKWKEISSYTTNRAIIRKGKVIRSRQKESGDIV